MRCHHLDPGVNSLPPKVSDKNHIGESRENESESFLGAENVICQVIFLHFFEACILISEHFILSRNIYLFGETFIFLVKLLSFQLLHLLLY